MIGIVLLLAAPALAGLPAVILLVTISQTVEEAP
jgi:hypothetical protein